MTQYVANLRAMADFYEANPDVKEPIFTEVFTVLTNRDEMIFNIAALGVGHNLELRKSLLYISKKVPGGGVIMFVIDIASAGVMKVSLPEIDAAVAATATSVDYVSLPTTDDDIPW